jgi:hypothetical protein
LYRYRMMLFGLKAAPRDFSFAVKGVIALFQKQGIRCTFYIRSVVFGGDAWGGVAGPGNSIGGALSAGPQGFD